MTDKVGTSLLEGDNEVSKSKMGTLESRCVLLTYSIYDLGFSSSTGRLGT